MSSAKNLKQEEKNRLLQQQLISDLVTLIKDIERCEKTIQTLKSELEAVNIKHQGRRTTREDIDYLTDLLKCANKKLTWEKQMASLQKRTPVLLAQMQELMNDKVAPPSDEMRVQMLAGLQALQAAMERLQGVKVE